MAGDAGPEAYRARTEDDPRSLGAMHEQPASRPSPTTPPDAGPRDPIEALLCEVWRELLGVERIGIDDDVFDLGAHSLTVMWAAARILDRTGLDLPSRWFYEEPTVAGLARRMAESSLVPRHEDPAAPRR